jgi:hypothetical protein
MRTRGREISGQGLGSYKPRMGRVEDVLGADMGESQKIPEPWNPVFP